MGASISVSGHFSYPEHRARFKRVNNDSPPSPCGLCREKVDFSVAAYRCPEPGCTYLLHDACYRRPQTIKRHFAHPQHRLTLVAVAGSGLSCSLCAQRLTRSAFAYTCTDRGCPGGGFRAHPRCCGLPRAAWSYQCSELECNEELCLACLLGDDDGPVQCCCVHCHNIDPAMSCLGRSAGVFFCACLNGMGCPALPT